MRSNASSRPAPNSSSRRTRVGAEPCVGRPVQLLLTVHRFRCVNALCRRSTFAEPLDELAVRYAQRTRGQELAVQNVGLALAAWSALRHDPGRPGAWAARGPVGGVFGGGDHGLAARAPPDPRGGA